MLNIARGLLADNTAEDLIVRQNARAHFAENIAVAINAQMDARAQTADRIAMARSVRGAVLDQTADRVVLRPIALHLAWVITVGKTVKGGDVHSIALE